MADHQTHDSHRSAPKTPFPAIYLFYLLIAAALIALFGSVVVYIV